MLLFSYRVEADKQKRKLRHPLPRGTLKFRELGGFVFVRNFKSRKSSYSPDILVAAKMTSAMENQPRDIKDLYYLPLESSVLPLAHIFCFLSCF